MLTLNCRSYHPLSRPRRFPDSASTIARPLRTSRKPDREEPSKTSGKTLSPRSCRTGREPERGVSRTIETEKRPPLLGPPPASPKRKDVPPRRSRLVRERLLPSSINCDSPTIALNSPTLQFIGRGTTRRRWHQFPKRFWSRSSLVDLEARVGIEPTNAAFAEPCLTTWLPRPGFLRCPQGTEHG